MYFVSLVPGSLGAWISTPSIYEMFIKNKNRPNKNYLEGSRRVRHGWVTFSHSDCLIRWWSHKQPQLRQETVYSPSSLTFPLCCKGVGLQAPQEGLSLKLLWCLGWPSTALGVPRGHPPSLLPGSHKALAYERGLCTQEGFHFSHISRSKGRKGRK